LKQDSIEEIKLLTKAMSDIRKKIAICIKDHNCPEFYEYLDKYMTLSQCLEIACWNAFGSRKTDNSKYSLKKQDSQTESNNV
jgi:hypothetical protein